MEIKSQNYANGSNSISVRSPEVLKLQQELPTLQYLDAHSPTRADIVARATKELGYTEGKNNNNKFGRSFGHNNVPWCGLFVDRIMANAGAEIPSMMSAQGGYNAAKHAGIFRSKSYTPHPGDVVFFNFPGGKNVDHVGLVTDVSKDGKTITTIEGNTSSSAAGSQRNGDGVYKKERTLSFIVGYAIPREIVTNQDKHN